MRCLAELLLALVLVSCGPEQSNKSNPSLIDKDRTVNNSTDDSHKLSKDFCAVQKVFDTNCISCHSATGQKPPLVKNLNQSSLVNKMGHHGKFLVKPNSSSESDLFIRITSKDPHLMMPRGAAPLSSADIQLIKSWIDAGASFDCKQ